MTRPGALSNTVFGVMVALLLMMVLIPIMLGIAIFATMGLVRALGLHELWVVTAMFSGPVVAIVVSILIARRIVRTLPSPKHWEDNGVCGNCGYSLQGLTGNQCPECGTTRECDRAVAKRLR